MNIEKPLEEQHDGSIRKSLAVDRDTYNMLQAICNSERRSKISQLKVLIENAHKQIVEQKQTA